MLTCTYCGAIFEAKYHSRHLRECKVYKEMQIESTSNSNQQPFAMSDRQNNQGGPQVLLTRPTEGDMVQQRLDSRKLSQKRRTKHNYLLPPLDTRKSMENEKHRKYDTTEIASLLTVSYAKSKDVTEVNCSPSTPPNSPTSSRKVKKSAWVNQVWNLHRTQEYGRNIRASFSEMK